MPSRAARSRAIRILGFALATTLAGCMPRLAHYDDDGPGGQAVVRAGGSSLLAFIHHRNRHLDPAVAAQVAERLAYWSERNHVDLKLLAAVVSVESAFDPRAQSASGAAGLGQLMPGTARDLGVSDAHDVDQNLMGTSRYLADLMDEWHDLRLAVASYNGGPVLVQRAIRNHAPLPAEQEQYVEAVLTQYRGL